LEESDHHELPLKREKNSISLIPERQKGWTPIEKKEPLTL
jgi:hypothetical protein